MQAITMSPTTTNNDTTNLTDNDGWQPAKASRRTRPQRAASPTPSSAASTRSTRSRGTSASAASTRGTSASAASTRRGGDKHRRSPQLPDVSTLVVGSTIDGTVTNVCDFGAFVAVGVCKDGLLHAGDADAPIDSLTVGQRIHVIVKHVKDNKVGLTQRELYAPAPRRFEMTKVDEQQAHQPSAAAAAAA